MYQCARRTETGVQTRKHNLPKRYRSSPILAAHRRHDERPGSPHLRNGWIINLIGSGQYCRDLGFSTLHRAWRRFRKSGTLHQPSRNQSNLPSVFIVCFVMLFTTVLCQRLHPAVLSYGECSVHLQSSRDRSSSSPNPAALHVRSSPRSPSEADMRRTLRL